MYPDQVAILGTVRAVLRRSATQESGQVMRYGRLLVDSDRHEVTYDGRPVSLTATEYRILTYLAARPGRVFSRDDIIDGALSRDAAVFDRTIDVHVTSIRRKLGEGAELVETVRGFGYRFSDRTTASSDQR
jgi:two-component system phosphate regulon response regulator PhoB